MVHQLFDNVQKVLVAKGAGNDDDENDEGDDMDGSKRGYEAVDLSSMGKTQRRLVVRRAMATSDQDNEKFLQKYADRLKRYESSSCVLMLMFIMVRSACAQGCIFCARVLHKMDSEGDGCSACRQNGKQFDGGRDRARRGGGGVGANFYTNQEFASVFSSNLLVLQTLRGILARLYCMKQLPSLGSRCTGMK